MSAYAALYRSIDEYGNVSYSDMPSENAELIELKELSTYTPTPIPTKVDVITEDIVELEQDLTPPNYKISIASPEQNESIWDGGGTVTIAVNISPALNSERADQIVFKLDGQRVGEPQSSTSFTLTNIDRGSHIVVASVVDKAGKVMKNSKSILFHIHRRSVAGP